MAVSLFPSQTTDADRPRTPEGEPVRSRFQHDPQESQNSASKKGNTKNNSS